MDEIVLPCAELEETLAFFVDRLGFRVDSISPADDPSTASISGHGVRIRLRRHGAVDPPLVLPPLQPSFVVSKSNGGAEWIEGRAGMRYRDLIPDRQGGRFIASLIEIPDGGPVADYVHFHDVRFQMIYCKKGWVRVVYEDQGPPFVLNAGDCVLQPPQIRHRVLDCSAGLEVIEIASPAHHQTFADHELALPTPIVKTDRSFGEQRFVRHEALAATWRPWHVEGFEHRDTGIASATNGLAGVRVIRRCGEVSARPRGYDGEMLFAFVLRGAATLRCSGRDPERLAEADAFVVPSGLPYALTECSEDVELLEVTLPGALVHNPPTG
jgi:quercetin dioxygenase-like cupin family protein